MTTPDDLTNTNAGNTAAGNTAGSDACDEPGCREAVEELYVYLDGELDETKRTTIKSHIDDCHECFTMFDFHIELKQVVSTRCQSEVPDGLKDRVFAALLSFDDPDR